MKFKEKIKSFFKPNILKIVLLIIILICGFYAASVVSPHSYWHSHSPITFFLIRLFMIPETIALIIIIVPFSYILSCLIVLLFNLIKTKKWLLILVIIIFILLTGIDESVVNNTINRPNYSCSVDSDCVIKPISRKNCGNPQCINQGWKYYDSMINSAFALSCIVPLYSCSCVENRCEPEGTE